MNKEGIKKRWQHATKVVVYWKLVINRQNSDKNALFDSNFLPKVFPGLAILVPRFSPYGLPTLASTAKPGYLGTAQTAAGQLQCKDTSGK